MARTSRDWLGELAQHALLNRVSGPVRFRDIIGEFGGETQQAALEALGRLRERSALARDDAGRYITAKDG